MTLEEQMHDALGDYYNHLEEQTKSNNEMLRRCGISEDEAEDFLDGLDVNGKIEIVDKPNGDRQEDDDRDFLTNVHVVQWAVGMSGDSWEGHIYGMIKDGRWIKIPYSC